MQILPLIDLKCLIHKNVFMFFDSDGTSVNASKKQHAMDVFIGKENNEGFMCVNCSQ